MKLYDYYLLSIDSYQPQDVFFEENSIALSFDDGPDPVYTPMFLELLAKYKIKATFFVLGSQVEKYPNILKQIAKQGHQIGNHTWSHTLSLWHTKNRIESEIETTQQLIKAITGQTPKLFRPPWGIMSETMNNVLISKQLKTVLWTQTVKDWQACSLEKLDRLFKKGLRDGAIYLMHDRAINSKSVSRQQLLSALEKMVQYAFAQGYRFSLLC